MQPEQQTPPPVQPPAPVKYPRVTSGKTIVLRILIIIIAVAIVLTGGIVLGKALQKTASQKKIDAAQAQIATLKRTYSAEAVTDIPGAKYLNIKEWNIRIPLDAKYQDVSYKYRLRSSGDFIEIYSPSLATIATCRDYDGEIGTIDRAATGTVPIPTANVVGIDDYLYMYQSFAQTCTSNPANLESPYKASLLTQFALLDSLPLSQRNTSPTTPNTPAVSPPAAAQQSTTTGN